MKITPDTTLCELGEALGALELSVQRLAGSAQPWSVRLRARGTHAATRAWYGDGHTIDAAIADALARREIQP